MAGPLEVSTTGGATGWVAGSGSETGSPLASLRKMVSAERRLGSLASLAAFSLALLSFFSSLRSFLESGGSKGSISEEEKEEEEGELSLPPSEAKATSRQPEGLETAFSALAILSLRISKDSAGRGTLEKPGVSLGVSESFSPSAGTKMPFAFLAPLRPLDRSSINVFEGVMTLRI